MARIGSSSSESTTDPAKVFALQIPFLRQLFRRGEESAVDASRHTKQFLNRDFPALFDQASGAVSGAQDAFTGEGFSSATGHLQSRLGGGGEVLREGIAAFGEDVGDFLNQQVKPGIRSEGVGTGGFGNVREGIELGFADQAALDTVRRGAAGMRLDDIRGQDAAAVSLGNLEATRGAGLQEVSKSIQQLVNLGLLPAQAMLNPFLALKQIIGNPTVLAGGSQSESDSFNVGVLDFGGGDATSSTGTG